MNKKILLITIAFAAISFGINTIHAEDSKTGILKESTDDRIIINKDKKIVKLNVDTAVSLALANNLDIKIEKLKFQNSIWDMATSWNVFVPDVTMSATWAQSNLSREDRATQMNTLLPYIPSYDPATGTFSKVYPKSFDVTQPGFSLMANFNLSLNLNAAMGLEIYQTVINFRSGLVSLDNAKKTVTRDALKSLYNLIVIQKQIDINRDMIKTAENRYNQAVINYRNGLISDYDRMSAEVAWVNLKPQLVNLENIYKNAMLSFKQMLGLKKEVEVVIDAKIETENKKSYNVDELIKKYLDNNLNLKILNLSLESLINARNIDIAFCTPTLSIGFTMDPTFQKDPMKDPWFKNNDYDYLYRNWKQTRGAFSLSVSLPVSSWFPMSKEQMNVVDDQYNLSETEKSYEKLKQSTELQIESTVLQLQKSIDSIDSLKQNVVLAQKAYDAASEAYRVGQKELLDVQTSENELEQAKLNLLNEEYNYTTGLLDLEYLTNTKLSKQ